MKSLCYLTSNILGGIVLVLLAIDPTRDLGPIFSLLAVAVVFAIGPRWMR